ncbi:hypothetical protein B0H10DRAFT_1945758 [Mycena sp. CBHHK59/15]|nr:hypothetical protein B0H10DRAFT_1945758 [Mycena sp. CBHHK59/15]
MQSHIPATKEGDSAPKLPTASYLHLWCPFSWLRARVADLDANIDALLAQRRGHPECWAMSVLGQRVVAYSEAMDSEDGDWEPVERVWTGCKAKFGEVDSCCWDIVASRTVVVVVRRGFRKKRSERCGILIKRWAAENSRISSSVRPMMGTHFVTF